MEQRKVPLPREVAGALKVLQEEYPGHYILLTAGDFDHPIYCGDEWKVICGFACEHQDNIFKLADAIRYGYYIDEPIIVTITTEMQERLKQYYESLDPDKQADAIDREFVLGERSGIRLMLDQLGIQIHGVNE